MSDNMDIVNKRLANLNDGDKQLLKQITDSRIEKIFEEKGYNHLALKTIFECSKYTSIERIAINELLWDFKYVYNINLFDVMLYILQFSDPNKILKILDSEKLQELKNEIIKNNVRAKFVEVKNNTNDLMLLLKDMIDGK